MKHEEYDTGIPFDNGYGKVVAIYETYDDAQERLNKFIKAATFEGRLWGMKKIETMEGTIRVLRFNTTFKGNSNEGLFGPDVTTMWVSKAPLYES